MSSSSFRQGTVEADAGLKIYWEAHGQGPGLICCNGVGVSTFFWKYILSGFAEQYTVVLWDYRGHGKSERPDCPHNIDLSIGASACDLEKVMAAAGLETGVVLGHSMGCQVALQLAIQAPDKVDGLVLLQGSAGRVLDTFFDNPNADQGHRVLSKIANRLGGRLDRFSGFIWKLPITWEFTWRMGLVDPHYTKKDDFVPYLEHLATLDSRLFLNMVREAHIHDAFPHLPEIHQPVLIIAAEKDTFTPTWLSRRIARELPNADLLVLADASHAALIEQPLTINHRLERFLNESL
jgi:pimeloyl-ACP methyl ester carboxylesterase